MTLYEFVTLALDDRATILWEQGDLLAASTHSGGRSAFYSLFDFFVEVTIDDSSNRITSVAPFKVGDRYDRLVQALAMPV